MYAIIEQVSYRAGQATILSITQLSVELNKGASISWSLMDADRQNIFEYGASLLSGNEYSSWVGDDEYVIRWLSEKINVTITSINQ